MWRKRLSAAGFVVGLCVGAWLLNAPAGDMSPLTKLGAVSAMPLLIALSPVLFLLSVGGGGFTLHAVSAVLTWTLIGFAGGAFADALSFPRRRNPATKTH